MGRIGLWTASVLLALLSGAASAGVGCSDEDGETKDTNPVDGGHEGYIVKDGGGEPAMHPNGEEACPTGACNYQSGEGCTEPLASCVPILDPEGQPAPTCIAAGTGTSGDACDAQEDCAAGYMCAEKECHKLCCGKDWSGCPSADEHCFRSLKLGSSPDTAVDTGAMLCYPVNYCDALEPDSCTKSGETCQIVDPTGATACLAEGSGAAGDPCPCQGGYLCADVGGS